MKKKTCAREGRLDRVLDPTAFRRTCPTRCAARRVRCRCPAAVHPAGVRIGQLDIALPNGVTSSLSAAARPAGVLQLRTAAWRARAAQRRSRRRHLHRPAGTRRTCAPAMVLTSDAVYGARTKNCSVVSRLAPDRLRANTRAAQPTSSFTTTSQQFYKMWLDETMGSERHVIAPTERCRTPGRKFRLMFEGLELKPQHILEILRLGRLRDLLRAACRPPRHSITLSKSSREARPGRARRRGRSRDVELRDTPGARDYDRS